MCETEKRFYIFNSVPPKTWDNLLKYVSNCFKLLPLFLKNYVSWFPILHFVDINNFSTSIGNAEYHLGLFQLMQNVLVEGSISLVSMQNYVLQKYKLIFTAEHWHR